MNTNTEVSTETINAILFQKANALEATPEGTAFVQVEEDVTGEGETPAPTVH